MSSTSQGAIALDSDRANECSDQCSAGDQSAVIDRADQEPRSGGTLSARRDGVRRAIRAVLAGVALAVMTSTSLVLAAETTTYRVQPGDTLYGLAARFGVSVDALVTANGITNPDLLFIGQAIEVPAVELERAALSSRGDRPATTTFVWPLNGVITTHFGEAGSLWSRGWHSGLDIGVPFGTVVNSIGAGVVIEAESYGWNSGYGNYVKIDHGGGLISLYAHFDEVYASVGQEVTAGTPLGTIGMTGATTGPHLHLEVRQDGELQDPLDYLL